MANVAFGGFESSDGVGLGLGNVLHGAVDGHIHARRLSAGIERDFTDVAEIDAGIGELALDQAPISSRNVSATRS